MKSKILLFFATIMLSSGTSYANDTSGGGVTPQLNPRGIALMAIEADRDAVIIELAGQVPDQYRPDYILELDQLQNHELINLMVGNSFQTMSFGDEGDYSNMVYTALPAPCRILDTRKYNPSHSTSVPIESRVAREVYDYGIDGQGGDAVCESAIPARNLVLLLALSAVSPSFPEKFPSNGYATLLNGNEMASGWTYIGNLPGVSGIYYQYNYNTPPYNKAASIVWDTDTRLITTLAAVTRRTPAPDIVLYSSGQGHFTLDVVGYFDNPKLCGTGTTYIDGLCWGPQQAADTWFNASGDCAGEGGRLPPAAAINGAVRKGDLPGTRIWGDGFYHDGDWYAQVTSSTLEQVVTITPTPYRCIFTPLTSSP